MTDLWFLIFKILSVLGIIGAAFMSYLKPIKNPIMNDISNFFGFCFILLLAFMLLSMIIYPFWIMFIN